MANYIILNGKNSNTITGLLIQNLPPISKPLQRTLIEEIDGRDGDIVTKLGYGAYDKEITIGLYGSYNVDDVISYFDSEGVVTFSNEPDKYYNYQIIDQIDFERLIRFKTATVRMHVQPFKYLLNEPEIEVDARSVTGEGQNIELKYTIENGSLSITPKGNTHQDSYTGINLLTFPYYETTKTINDITFTVKDDGTIHVQGTASARAEFLIRNRDINLSITAGETYTLATSGLGTVDSTLWLDTYGQTSNFLDRWALSQTTTYTSAVAQSKDIKPLLRISVANGATVNTDVKVWLYKGSYDETKTYEPFVGGSPSPSPDFPQPIEVVTGDNTINVYGKNLFDLTNIQNNGTGRTSFVVNDNDIIMTATTGGTYRFIYKQIDNLTIGEPYTIKIGSYNDTSTNKLAQWGITKTGGSYYGSVQNLSNSQSLTIIPTETSIQFRAGYLTNSCGTNDILTIGNIQLEQGSTATEYQPYQSQTYSLNLGSIELCKIGTYQDYIYKENNKWYKHSEIGKVVLDGSEDWMLRSDVSQTSGYYTFRNNDYVEGEFNTNSNGYSNYFGVRTSTSVTTNHIRLLNATGYGTQICIDGSIAQTSQALKTWLSTNNVEVYYIKITPTNTEITDTDLINQLESINSASAYKEVTNISSTCASGNSLMYMSAVSVGMPNTTIKNNGNIFAKPILTIYGSGEISVYLDTVQVLQIDLGDYGSITIDVSQLEAYNESTGDLMNRNVIGDYSNLKINCGDNDLTFSGNVMGFTMTKYNRWL